MGCKVWAGALGGSCRARPRPVAAETRAVPQPVASIKSLGESSGSTIFTRFRATLADAPRIAAQLSGFSCQRFSFQFSDFCFQIRFGFQFPAFHCSLFRFLGSDFRFQLPVLRISVLRLWLSNFRFKFPGLRFPDATACSKGLIQSFYSGRVTAKNHYNYMFLLQARCFSPDLTGCVLRWPSVS